MIEDITLDHVALGTEHQRDAWPRYRGDLAGIWLGDGGDLKGFLSSQARFANGMKVEFLEPYRVEDNDFLRRFLDRNGPGPHHLTYKVKNIVAALAETEAAGYRPVGVSLDSDDWKEAFLHPKDAPGIVVQLAQAAHTGRDVAEPAADDTAPRVPEPATLVRVVHAVASMHDGLRLFAGLLGGEETGRGEDEAATWVDLAWPGPGRIRVLAPCDEHSPVATWLDGRAGRLHHLAFTVDRPGEVPDAVALADGSWEVPPERNLGVRLILSPPERSELTTS
jgi:catechol 2,3-dioxygenase-like lactoylglutathione lyase family enzyme